MGILSVKDVVTAIAREDVSNDTPVTMFLRPAVFVPDTKLAGQLFREMREVGNLMVMAVDEYGGIAGLVTLKQLIEEVVGPVGEEGRQPEVEYEAIDENTYHIDGGMQIDEANDELDLGLPRGDYNTVAGFILESLGRIPVEGDHFHHDSMRLEGHPRARDAHREGDGLEAAGGSRGQRPSARRVSVNDPTPGRSGPGAAAPWWRGADSSGTVARPCRPPHRGRRFRRPGLNGPVAASATAPRSYGLRAARGPRGPRSEGGRGARGRPIRRDLRAGKWVCPSRWAA